MSAQNIQIVLDDVKTEKGGILLVSLFREGNGFPDSPSKAYKVFQFSASNKLILNDIPAGEYGLALLHDLDSDKKMTYSIVGMPKDGFASSPDGGSAFFKPEFSKAKFMHAAGGTRLRLKVHYFL